ncbi:hypothetical protein D3C76_1004910 [compost metagenome]
MNWGIIVTSPGSSIVDSTSTNINPLPLTFKRANAYPTSEQENTVPMIGKTVVIRELTK